MRAKTDLSNRIKLILPVQSHRQKYFLSRLTQITSIIRAIPSHMRGVSRSSRTLERDAVDAGGAFDERRGRGRRSRVVLTPRRWRQVGGSAMSALSGPTRGISAGDGGNKARSPGRARRKPLKPLRAGMPGESGGPVALPLCFFVAQGAAGASGTRHSRLPSWGSPAP